MTYREKHFAVSVDLAKHPEEPGEIKVSMTTNGYQWNSFTATPREARMIIEEMERQLGSTAAKSTPGVDADKVIERIKRTLADDRGIARACAQVMATGDGSAVSALVSLRKDIDLIAGSSGPDNEAIVNALNEGACFTRFWNGQEYFPRLDPKKACAVLSKLRDADGALGGKEGV